MNRKLRLGLALVLGGDCYEFGDNPVRASRNLK
jgi:hypothetical protein